DDVRQSIRMNGAVSPPVSQLVQLLTEVLQQLPIDDFDVAGRRQQCDQPRDVVHNQPRLAFAFVGTPRLLAQQPRLLQPDGRLVRRDIQKEPFCFSWEIEPFRSRGDAAEVTVTSQTGGCTREFDLADAYLYAR